MTILPFTMLATPSTGQKGGPQPVGLALDVDRSRAPVALFKGEGLPTPSHVVQARFHHRSRPPRSLESADERHCINSVPLGFHEE